MKRVKKKYDEVGIQIPFPVRNVIINKPE